MYSSINNKIDMNKISQLMSKLGYLLDENQLQIDSRKVDSTSIFCAYPGNQTDGRDFIHQAISHGVKCIIKDGEFSLSQDNNYVIDNLRDYVGILASYKYGNPSSKLKTIGVTGTNGKTSISQWFNQIYTHIGYKSSVVGTLGAGIYPQITSHAATTPDPITLQQLLDEFYRAHVYLVAIEVSSHALDQGRVNGVHFETAIFTNLTQDHLDYHLTLESYYNAKRKLFYWQGLKNVIINTDDSYGMKLCNEIKSVDFQGNILTYGISSGDLVAKDISITLLGTSFTLRYQDEEALVEAKVIGKFNIYNMLAVAAYLILDGYSIKQIAQYIGYIKPVSGRMDAIFIDNKPLVIIDFAHTPDALKNVLQTLGDIKQKGKLYCVFGCGGNRDALKRPIMGDIAVTHADCVVITSDNPRYEKPLEIIQQIVGNTKNTKNIILIEDRKTAIETAINMANPIDTVLIAGKGHEEYQDINGVKSYFSDFKVAKEILER